MSIALTVGVKMHIEQAPPRVDLFVISICLAGVNR